MIATNNHQSATMDAHHSIQGQPAGTDAGALRAVVPSAHTLEARIARAAYGRCLSMTAKTAEQAAVAWKYTALAKESCARAGLFEESLHLCTLLLKWSYVHDRLSQRL